VDLSGIDINALNSLFPAKPKRNPIIAGVSSGIDQLQGLGYNALAAGADAVGLNRARDWLVDRALINQDEAYASGRPDLERVEDQDLSTALPFAAYQIAKQVPQIGAALGIGALTGGAGLVPAGLSRAAASLPSVVGGGGLRAGADFAARRAALQAGERFAGNLMGGVGLGTTMGAGALYGESVEAGDPSPYAALAAAPLYGATEGLSTAVLGGTLAKSAFTGRLPTRMAKAGGVSGLGGAASELAQNEMEMAFNPTLPPEEIASRRLNAAVVGGMAEGAFGSLGGLRRRPQPTNLLPDANISEETIAPPPSGPFPLTTIGERGLAPIEPPLVEPTREPRYFGPTNLLPAPPPPPATTQDFPNDPLVITPGGTVARMSQLSGLQPDLFGGPDVLPGAGYAEQPAAPAPSVYSDPNQMSLLGPTALVPSEFGYAGAPNTDPRAPSYGMPPLIAATLRQANGGKYNAELSRFVPEFTRALYEGPQAVQAVLAKYDGRRTTLSGDVFSAAEQIAADYQSRMVNAMAAEGMSRAQPGRVVGVAPTYGPSIEAIFDENQRRQVEETADAGQQQLAGAIADTDARVAGGDQQRSAQARREVLDSVLGGAANGGNARNRFIKALRKQGFKDTIIRPEEQQAIDRFFRNKAIDRYFAPVDQDPDVIPSAPNEMGDLVPEKAEPESKRGKPKRVNENRSFRLTPPPSTEEDLAALEKARAKRERKAGGQPQAEPEQPQGTDRRQGILFTKKGAVSKAADQTEKTDAVQEPSPAPVPPRERARTGPEVGEKVPGEGQAAAEGQAAKKPRKAKVKAKVGDTEVELEIENPEQKLEAIRNDIDKFKRFVACLRRK
jgi:hypothetical protein